MHTNPLLHFAHCIPPFLLGKMEIKNLNFTVNVIFFKKNGSVGVDLNEV
jgi:hypothetical protein